MFMPLTFACGEGGATAGETAATTSTQTSSSGTTGNEDTAATADDLNMQAEDFVCLAEWEQVRRFRITNLLGDLEQTLAVANSDKGGEYPVGTVIQLIPNEAMVKRGSTFAPETNNWEYFSLSTSTEGTEILERGASGVTNAFGGDCLGCHSAADAEWDFVCENGHGCAELPFTPEAIEGIQDADPRCPS